MITLIFIKYNKKVLYTITKNLLYARSCAKLIMSIISFNLNIPICKYYWY